MKISGSTKLTIMELQRLYENLHYEYCEEIETLIDEEERSEKYEEADRNLEKFRRLIKMIG